MTDDEPPGTGQTPSGGWEKLHPRTLAVTGITMVGIAALAGVPTTIGIAAATSLSVALAWVLPLAAVLIIAVAGYDLLRIRHTRYRVTDERVELESGLWFRSRRSLARERVRTVDLSADPLSRVFGLVRVKVGTGETGSGEGATTERSIDLDSVSRAAAEKLRQELLHRGGTLAAPGAESPDERIVTWRPAWLRYAPLSFLTPALALALAGAIFQVAEWFGRVDVPIEFVVGVVERHGIWTVLGVGLAAFLAVGALGSVLLHAESSWNHRLDREPGGTLRVRRGLLVSRSLSLEEQRIRGVEIVEPLGIRLASAARLDVIAIGLKSADAASDLTTLVPAAPRQVVSAAAEAVSGSTGGVALAPHPRAARSRRLRRAGLLITVLVATTVTAHLLWEVPGFWSAMIIVAAVLAGSWAVCAAFDAYSSLGHAVDDEHLVTRRGSLRRSTARLRRSGIISWRIRQSPFQRRLGLITLDATTAGGRVHYPVVDIGEHDGIEFAAHAAPGILTPDLFLPQR